MCALAVVEAVREGEEMVVRDGEVYTASAVSVTPLRHCKGGAGAGSREEEDERQREIEIERYTGSGALSGVLSARGPIGAIGDLMNRVRHPKHISRFWKEACSRRMALMVLVVWYYTGIASLPPHHSEKGDNLRRSSPPRFFTTSYPGVDIYS